MKKITSAAAAAALAVSLFAAPAAAQAQVNSSSINTSVEQVTGSVTGSAMLGSLTGALGSTSADTTLKLTFLAAVEQANENAGLKRDQALVPSAKRCMEWTKANTVTWLLSVQGVSAGLSVDAEGSAVCSIIRVEKAKADVLLEVIKKTLENPEPMDDASRYASIVNYDDNYFYIVSAYGK